MKFLAYEHFFLAFFRVRQHRTILGRLVLGKEFLFFPFWLNFSSQIRTRDSRVRSENATAVLCRPPDLANEHERMPNDPFRLSYLKLSKASNCANATLLLPGIKAHHDSLTTVELERPRRVKMKTRTTEGQTFGQKLCQ